MSSLRSDHTVRFELVSVGQCLLFRIGPRYIAGTKVRGCSFVRRLFLTAPD
jgi:hypothetical protein